MTKRHLPQWVPYLGFCAVVVVVAAFVVVTSTNSDGTSNGGGSVESADLPPRSEPGGVALRAVRFLQAGSIPSVIALYDPLILQTFGRQRIADSLALRRPSLAGQTLRVTLTDQVGGRRLVVVSSEGNLGNAEYSFTLEPAGSSWRIVHDNLLGDALAELAASRVQNRVDPGSGEQSVEATRAGQRTERRYRELILTTEP
jgi:hypothetical protein